MRKRMHATLTFSCGSAILRTASHIRIHLADLDCLSLQASFGYDTCAVDFSYNSIIAALPCALTELQKRMTNPFRVLSWSAASNRTQDMHGLSSSAFAYSPSKFACSTILVYARQSSITFPLCKEWTAAKDADTDEGLW